MSLLPRPSSLNCIWRRIPERDEKYLRGLPIKYRENALKYFILINKVKNVNFALEQNMKDQRGSRGIALLFL